VVHPTPRPHRTCETSNSIGSITVCCLPINRVTTCLRGTSAQASALVVQPDGRIVAVGTTNGPNGDLNFGLARYNLDGTLDPTFNADSINPGLSITDFDNRALDDGTVERS